jgi:hypothetical protein
MGINTSHTKGSLILCRKLAREHPGLVTLENAGKSYQGRDIVALVISEKKGWIRI